MTRVGASVAIIAACLMVLSACSTAPTPAPPNTSATELEARIFQYRLDYADRVLEVGLENTGANVLEVDSVRFESDLFDGPAVSSIGPTVAPAAIVDVRVALPPARCDGVAGAERVIATLTDGREITLVPVDDEGTLDRIVTEDCFAADVARVVTFTLPDSVRRTGQGAGAAGVIDIALAPVPREQAEAGGANLSVTSVSGTTLLSPAGDESARWSVDASVKPGDPPSTISLDVRPARCDPHAVAEDKRGTILPVSVTVGDGSGVIDLPAGPALKADIYAFVAEYCAF